jgi:5'-3' exoribonuclease 2
VASAEPIDETNDSKPSLKRKLPNDASEGGDKEDTAAAGDAIEVEKVDEDTDDPVRLWEDGWKQRYYKVKFDVEEDDIDFRHKIARHYAIGLQWVLKYYYQGVPSWNWYFPYHYAPFASDFVEISEAEADFSTPSEPFKPFEQLMAVFPAASRKHVPEPWQILMTDEVIFQQMSRFKKIQYHYLIITIFSCVKQKSPIIDFYPEDFQVDLNGKKQAWQGVALLPFVDEKRLRKALETVNDELSPEERMFF